MKRNTNTKNVTHVEKNQGYFLKVNQEKYSKCKYSTHNENTYMENIMPDYEHMYSIDHINVILYIPNSENMPDSDQKRREVPTFDT